MFNFTIEEVFASYYECRKSKRNSKGALQFELNLEENLISLWQEVKNGTWQPGNYTCFIVEKPVKREIFAAPFKDRIIHHILINRMNDAFEKYFIFDSYACRLNKGTHAAIKRVEHFIKSETKNGKENCYILKLDIQGFFMAINKNLLYKKLCDFIDKNNFGKEEKYLCKKIVFSNSCNNCIKKSPQKAWNNLPKNKSLFFAQEDCGLPIGNLTSQVFANFYLTEFDHFIKSHLKVKKYVRYVDDFIIIHKEKKLLLFYVKLIKEFLKTHLYLTLHPKKIYIQKANYGVSFLGTFIKISHTVISNRTINNFKSKIKNYIFKVEQNPPSQKLKQDFFSCTNSYLGILSHYKTYKKRIKILKLVFESFWNKYFKVKKPATKIEKL